MAAWALLILFLLPLACVDSRNATFCPESSVSVVSALSSGIEVRWVGGGNASFSLRISNHTFPPPCQSDPSRCHITIMSRYLVISGQQLVTIVDLEGNSSQTPISVPVGFDCDPTDLFFITIADLPHIVAACEHNSSPMSILRYIYLSLEVSATTGLIVPPELNTASVPLEQSSEFSQTVLVPNHFCSNAGDSSFYLVSGGIIWSHSAIEIANTFVARSTSLQNCTAVQYLEYTGSSGNFTIYCSNGVAISYSTCSEQVQYHFLSQGGLLFPCPALADPVSVFYRNDSIRVVQDSNPSVTSSFNHTVGGIRHGTCMGNSSFTAIATNGSLFVFNLRTESVSQVLAFVCNDSCILPPFNPVGFPLYDVVKSSFMMVSLVEDCNQPVVDRLVFDGDLLPSFISVVITGIQRWCECSVTVEETTEPPDSLVTTMIANTETPPDVSLNDTIMTPLSDVAIGIIVSTVIVVVVVVTGVVLTICFYKLVCRKRDKKDVPMAHISELKNLQGDDDKSASDSPNIVSPDFPPQSQEITYAPQDLQKELEALETVTDPLAQTPLDVLPKNLEALETDNFSARTTPHVLSTESEALKTVDSSARTPPDVLPPSTKITTESTPHSTTILGLSQMVPNYQFSKTTSGLQSQASTPNFVTPTQETCEQSIKLPGFPQGGSSAGASNGPYLPDGRSSYSPEPTGHTIYSSPQDAQGTGQDSGLVTGTSNVVPAIRITSDTLNAERLKAMATEDQRNDRTNKIRQFPPDVQ